MKIIKAMALWLALSLTWSLVQARPLEAIRRSGTLVIATEGQFAPFNYFQGSQLTGFEVDLADAVAHQMGLKVEWKTLSFDALLVGLSQDRWDLVIASHSVTPERAKAVTFTQPHYCSGAMLVSLNPKIRSIADLQGKVVAVQTGSVYLDALKKVPAIGEVKNYPKDTDARSALAAHRVDAWVTDKFVALDAIASHQPPGLQRGDLLFADHIAAAVALGNTGLADAYNQALNQLVKDGRYAALSNRYFKEDVRCK